MASSGAVLTTIAVAAAGAAGAVVGLMAGGRRRPYLPGSLAEYEPRRRDPLRRALRLGFAGIQLPLWPGANGELYVGRAEPAKPEPYGADTLRRGVLEPLLRRVAATGGSVYPDRDEPFDLILELPGDETEPGVALRAYHLLDGCLRDHAAILTRWSAAGVVPGAVTVTITGRLSARTLLAEREERCACVDGTLDDLGSPETPPELAALLSEHWSWRFGWDGRGAMPPEERHLLHWLVREAHAEGRRVRFLGIPERPRRIRTAFWVELSAAGVDLISSRRVRALTRHLRRHPSLAPAGAPLPKPAAAPVSPATAPADAGGPGGLVRTPIPPAMAAGPGA
jgi:hypothetical protein